jgi:hypothetical protein
MHLLRSLSLLVMTSALLIGCSYVRGPEERTDDGLVRVPSRADGGVYRLPGAEFSQYKRLILEPAIIEFKSGWRDAHKEVQDSDIARIRKEAVELFRKEFTRQLVDRGNYEFADVPAADVLLVTPRVIDLDIPAPDAGTEIGTKSYTPGPIEMQVTGDLRDGASNALVARVTIFEGQERYGFNELRLANRTTNAHEMRMGFGRWSKMVHEALNVAKATKPGASD